LTGGVTTYRPARTRRRRLAALLAIVAIAAALGHGSLASSSSPPVAHHGGGLGRAGGAVPAGTTVFDDSVPGVANLDRALLAALRRAATDAAAEGVELHVDSGWRSPAYQRHLLRQAVRKYGSAAEARRWVATPRASAHVSGHAVDLGPAAAQAWLSAHGAAYGLCQIYANEPWHYELRSEAPAHGCPAMFADAAQR
jgi:hypothetical protein